MLLLNNTFFWVAFSTQSSLDTAPSSEEQQFKEQAAMVEEEEELENVENPPPDISQSPIVSLNLLILDGMQRQSQSFYQYASEAYSWSK